MSRYPMHVLQQYESAARLACDHLGIDPSTHMVTEQAPTQQWVSVAERMHEAMAMYHALRVCGHPVP